MLVTTRGDVDVYLIRSASGSFNLFVYCKGTISYNPILVHCVQTVSITFQKYWDFKQVVVSVYLVVWLESSMSLQRVQLRSLESHTDTFSILC